MFIDRRNSSFKIVKTNMNKLNSPFTPGNPVPVELFVGREEQIKEVLRYVKQTLSGRQQNVFLIGDRGIGKSSLASFLRHYVNTKFDILCIHAFLGSVSTLKEMVHRIFEQLLKETRSYKWYENIKVFFGKYIREVGLFGISVSFNPPEEDLKELVNKFPEILNNILEKIKDQKRGLFIILDDINGLAELKEFADWYKSFVDEVATHYKDFPVFIMLVGLPEKRDKLSKLQPSLMRIFKIIEIGRLSDNEVKNFLYKAFNSVNMEIKEDALELMVKFSSGLPILMHEIGDATFWLDKDGIIDLKDATIGILKAAEEVGRKYLDPKVYRAIRSEKYRSILRKMGEMRISKTFNKKEIESKLEPQERKVLNNFLRKLKKLGVIESDLEGRGSYRFVNEIYPIYIWMESNKPKRNK